jgi:hypothetical protein
MKSQALTLISSFFVIGSITFEEAIECAMVASQYINNDQLKNELLEIRTKNVHMNTITNKNDYVVAAQLELFS